MADEKTKVRKDLKITLKFLADTKSGKYIEIPIKPDENTDRKEFCECNFDDEVWIYGIH